MNKLNILDLKMQWQQ